MVSSGELESDYDCETDRSVLLRRRREATGDDEEAGEEDENNVRRIDYDDESDGCDGAPEYYDDEDVDEEASSVDEFENLAEQVTEHGTASKQIGEEKVTYGDKDVFAVPRTCAFYMHDDRFDGRAKYDQRSYATGTSKPSNKDRAPGSTNGRHFPSSEKTG